MTPFTRKILLGLSLGVAVGIILGEQAGFFRFVVEGFIRLLQMTVLPYVTVSLIAEIGGLDMVKARRLFLRVGVLSSAVGAGLGAVFLMPTFSPDSDRLFLQHHHGENRPPFDLFALHPIQPVSLTGQQHHSRRGPLRSFLGGALASCKSA
jgi:Na+/H+-dicarboxylate symporter